jgi:hypothetical protein
LWTSRPPPDAFSGTVSQSPIGSDGLKPGVRLFVLMDFLDENRLLRPKTL